MEQSELLKQNLGNADRILMGILEHQNNLSTGDWVNRDLVGARHILLRVLLNTLHCFSVAIIKH
jgi:hypothetical protein